MAHFAKLDENDIVIEILAVKNQEILDDAGQEQEQLGIDYLYAHTGHLNWKQVSYNQRIRKFYPSLGFVYNSELDAFHQAKPTGCDDWILDTEKLIWIPPVPRPGPEHEWDDLTSAWYSPEELEQLEYQRYLESNNLANSAPS